MYIPDYEYNTFDSVQTQTSNIKSELHFIDHGMVIEKTPISDLKRKDNISTYDQKNRFFKGLLIATPASIALWGITIFVIKLLY